MGFNYGYEKKKFEKEWAKLRETYREAGMSEEAIQKLYDFDLKAFNRKRSDIKHEQSINSILKEDNEEHCLSKSSVLKNCADELTVTDTYSLLPKRYRWIDEIKNESLYEKVVSLPERDKEFLTLLIEGYSREEIAKIRGIKVQSINKKIAKFKSLFADAAPTSANTQ